MRMKAKDWIRLGLIGSGAILTDQVAKSFFSHPSDRIEIGQIILSFTPNSGIIFGGLTQLPSLLKTVSLSTLGAFLLFTYFSLQFLLPGRTFHLRASTTLLTAGMLGNVIDRMRWGYVIDFISFKRIWPGTAIFNLADVFQWIGLLWFIAAFVVDGKHIWPEVNSRKNLWVNRAFQIRFCLLLAGTALAFGLIAGVFAYSFLNEILKELGFFPGKSAYMETVLRTFFLGFLAILAVYTASMFWIARRVSHRMVGPVFAFDRFLQELFAGQRPKLRLRSEDQFKDEFEEFARKIEEKISPREP